MPVEWGLSAVAAALSAAVNTGKIAKAAKGFIAKHLKSEESSDFDEQASATEDGNVQEIQNEANSIAHDATSMSILEEAGKINTEIVAAMKNRRLSPIDMQRQIDVLEQRYCFYLNNFKKRNNGKLPASLEAQWNSCRCDLNSFPD